MVVPFRHYSLPSVPRSCDQAARAAEQDCRPASSDRLIPFWLLKLVTLPFMRSQMLLEGETYATSNLVIPRIYDLRGRLEKH